MALEIRYKYEIRRGEFRHTRRQLTKEQAVELRRQGATVTLVDDLDRRQPAGIEHKQRVRAVDKGFVGKNLSSSRSAVPVVSRAKKWSGKLKVTRSSFYTHVVVQQLSSSGKVLNFRFPRENYTGTR